MDLQVIGVVIIGSTTAIYILYKMYQALFGKLPTKSSCGCGKSDCVSKKIKA